MEPETIGAVWLVANSGNRSMLSKLVLVVEDEPILAMLLEEVLNDAGLYPVVARSMDQAVEFITSTQVEPFAIVTDIRLPDGSGWTVGTTSRTYFPQVPIVYTSGDSGKSWAELGVSGSVFLQKPVAGQVIVDAIHQLSAVRAIAC
jgi:CheY-like chemotaxis protein